jgi:hypothetical protein
MSAPRTSETWHPKGIAAVLDTSTLIRAWLSQEANPRPAREVVRLAGQAYDSFTSPSILIEVEEVLIRPRFGAPPAHVRLLLNTFVPCAARTFAEASQVLTH